MDATAAVVREPRKLLDVVTVRLSEPRPDEIRVRMVGAGVCHSAVIARDQVYPVPLPVIPGDEGAGVVEAVGEAVTSVETGDHVVLGFNSCGTCARCLSGHPSNCRSFFDRNFGGFRPDGSSPVSLAGKPVAGSFFGQSSFSSHVVVPARIAVKVPQDLPLDLLAPLGCGVMTGAGAVLNVLKPVPGGTFAVFGTGAVGFSGLLAAKAAGCTTIIATDIVGERLAQAEELGATHVIDSRTTDVVEAVRDITGGEGVDYALDAVGVSAVFAQMAESLATRGHGVLVGAPNPGDLAGIDVGALLTGAPRLSMVIEGDAVPHEFIPRLLRLYRAGLLPFDRLIRKYPLAEVNEALADSESGVTVKPVLTFD